MIVIPDITAPIFDLVLRFLYGSQFEDWKYALVVEARPGELDVDALRPACEILCFALKYDLLELKDIIASHIQNSCAVTYRSVLAAAKFVYSNAPSVEPWFREFIIRRTQEALADPDLADETWFEEIFEHGHNGLSKDIFQCYKNMNRVSERAVPTPIAEDVLASETDRSTNPEDDVLSVQPHREVLYEDFDKDQCSSAKTQDWIEVSPESPSIYGEIASCHRLEEILAETKLELEPLELEEIPAELAYQPGAMRAELDADSLEEAPTLSVYNLAIMGETPEALVEEILPEPPYGVEETVQVAECPPVVDEPPMKDSMHNKTCAKRRIHLRKKSRWEKCATCEEEVTAMAKDAAKR